VWSLLSSWRERFIPVPTHTPFIITKTMFSPTVPIHPCVGNYIYTHTIFVVFVSVIFKSFPLSVVEYSLFRFPSFFLYFPYVTSCPQKIKLRFSSFSTLSLLFPFYFFISFNFYINIGCVWNLFLHCVLTIYHSPLLAPH